MSARNVDLKLDPVTREALIGCPVCNVGVGAKDTVAAVNWLVDHVKNNHPEEYGPKGQN